MNFGAAWQELLDTIHRPEKTADAKAAINKAIAVLATRRFAWDTASATLTLVSTAYEQSFEVTASPFTRFKKVKWLKPTGYKKYVTYRDPGKIFHDGCECLDVYYQEGINLIFKLSALRPTASIGYYKYHAALSVAGDTDWMLDMMWPAVRDYALTELYGQTGDDQERARYNTSYQQLADMYYQDMGEGTET